MTSGAGLCPTRRPHSASRCTGGIGDSELAESFLDEKHVTLDRMLQKKLVFIYSNFIHHCKTPRRPKQL